MDTVSAKEAAITKLKIENERLSTRLESSSQVICKETTKHCQKINILKKKKETTEFVMCHLKKDIEIDVSNQKCQTFWPFCKEPLLVIKLKVYLETNLRKFDKNVIT